MDDFKEPLDRPQSPGANDSQPAAASATGIFGKPSPPPSIPAGQDVLASLARPKNAPGQVASEPAPLAPEAQQPPRDAGPGDFTRMLQTLKSAPAGSNPAAELAGIFKQVSIEKTPSAKAADTAAPAKPFAMPIPKPANEPQPPASAAPEGASGATPGGFTQLFSTFSEKSAPPPALPQQSAPPESGPGEFTRLFQSVQSPAKAAPALSTVPAAPSVPPAQAPPSGEPGAFTRMFATPSAQTSPDQSAFPGPRPEPRPEADFSFAPAANQPPQRLSEQGGFTQLLQALSKEEPAGPPQTTAPPPLPSGSNSPAAAGGFTQLLQSLSAAPGPAQPAAAPRSINSAAAGTPGEFTRVISGSALRESASGAAAPPAIPSARPPLAAPPLPAIPAAAPHAAPPAFAFPPAPAAQAPPPPAVSAPSGLQKYLPLILLVNVFLLLVIVLILIFVLRHR